MPNRALHRASRPAAAPRRLVLLAALGVLAVPGTGAAQLPTGADPSPGAAAAVAELLVARGVLTGMEAQLRPLDRDRLRARLGTVDTLSLAPGDRARVRWLRGALGPAPDREGWTLEAGAAAGVQAGTRARRVLALADDAPRELWPTVQANLRAAFGPFTLEVAPRWEDRLLDDVDYPERARGDDAGLALRLPRALLRGEWRWVTAELGERAWNWGPAGVPGVVVSPLGYHRRGAGLELGPEALRFQWRTEVLSDGTSSETGAPVSRWFSMHRLRWRASERFEVAIWETMVTADEAGRDRASLNPFAPYSFGRQFGLGDGRNVSLGTDVTWRPSPALLLEGQFLLDDAVVWKSGSNPYPNRFGFTLQARGPVGAGMAWRAWGTGLSGLAHTTFRPEENFLDDGAGLGRVRPDHLAGGVELALPLGFGAAGGRAAGAVAAGDGRAGRAGGGAPGAPDVLASVPGAGILALGLRWRRQGARTFADPFPDLPRSPDTPDFPAFSSEIEREVVALHLGVDWDVGPFSLQGASQLQRRRFPASGAESEWGGEALVQLLWRIGSWRYEGR